MENGVERCQIATCWFCTGDGLALDLEEVAAEAGASSVTTHGLDKFESMSASSGHCSL